MEWRARFWGEISGEVIMVTFSWRRVVFCLLFIIILLRSSTAMAECSSNFSDYAEVAITAPTSLVLTGLGYAVDGVSMVAVGIGTTVVICGGPMALTWGLSNDASASRNFLNICMQSTFSSSDGDAWHSNVGKTVYEETRPWRVLDCE